MASKPTKLDSDNPYAAPPSLDADLPQSTAETNSAEPNSAEPTNDRDQVPSLTATDAEGIFWMGWLLMIVVGGPILGLVGYLLHGN